MRRFIRSLLILLLCWCMMHAEFASALPNDADITDEASLTELEELKKLLQKGLTLFELDQEINRLSQKEELIHKQIADTRIEIDQQLEKVQSAREQAGQVLRAYYSGERDSLWLLLFSARSFSDALSIAEYLYMIIEHDFTMIRRYTEAYKQLKEMHERLVLIGSELTRLKEQFVIQRDRMAALQKEIDEALKQSAEAEKLAQQIQELTTLWQTKGIQFFKMYFEALSSAMFQLPDVITIYEDSLKIDGLETVFRITDVQLQEFLRSKNEFFESFTFSFQQDRLVAEGKKDGLEMKIIGHYKVEEQPENVVRFQIEELVFNGFALPDTTRADLHEQFEMAFYPQKISSFLLVSSVAIEPGIFTVRLKTNFFE